MNEKLGGPLFAVLTVLLIAPAVSAQDYPLFTEEGGSETFSTGDYSVETTGTDGVGDRSLNLTGETQNLDDLEEPVEVWFEYTETGEDDWQEIDAGTVSGTEEFNAVVTDLDPGTDYTFEAYTKDDSGGEMSETTGDYTVSTLDADPGVDWLRFRGDVSGLEPFTDEIEDDILFRFEYREEGATSWNEVDAEFRTTDGEFNERVEDLQEDTVYEFRAFSEDGVETSSILSKKTVNFRTDTGGAETFSTPDYSVETTGTDGVGERSLNLTGETQGLSDLEEPIEVWFEYREEGSTSWNEVDAGAVDGSQTFNRIVTDLDPDTTYEFEAFTKDYSGGTDQDTTSDYSVSTEGVAGVGVDWIEFEGLLDGVDSFTSQINDEIQMQFQYRQTGESSWNAVDAAQRDSSGPFSERVEGLESGTEYKFRAVSEGEERVGAEDNKTTISGVFTAEGGVVSFGADFTFDVSIDEASINDNDLVELDYTVENVGDETDTQDIEFSFDDESNVVDTSEDVSLSPGDADSGTLTYDASSESDGSYDVFVSSVNDTAEDTVFIGDVIAFEEVGEHTWDVPDNVESVEVLVVGGGGGGGTSGDFSTAGAGGGGAGGLVFDEVYDVSDKNQIDINVGGGGEPGALGDNNPGETGESSFFDDIVASGGGGGSGGNMQGLEGGSGGGSRGELGGVGNQSDYSEPSTGYGFDGGESDDDPGGAPASGGGGAIESGRNVDGVEGEDGGAGGDGRYYGDVFTEEFGENGYFAGGGGGGPASDEGGSGGAGGLGGGADGWNSDSNPAGDAIANTGGGGGGGTDTSADNLQGGSGGSGIVLLTYSESDSISEPVNPLPEDDFDGLGLEDDLSVELNGTGSLDMGYEIYVVNESGSDIFVGGGLGSIGERVNESVEGLDLDTGTEYEWYAEAEYEGETETSEVWNFTTVEMPEVSIEPEDGEKAVGTNPELNITVETQGPINITAGMEEGPELDSFDNVDQDETVSIDTSEISDFGGEGDNFWNVTLEASGISWDNSEDPYEFTVSELEGVDFSLQNFEDGDNLNPGSFEGLNVFGEEMIEFAVSSNPSGEEDMNFRFNLTNGTDEHTENIGDVDDGDIISLDISEVDLVDENFDDYSVEAYYLEDMSRIGSDFESDSVGFSTHVAEVEFTHPGDNVQDFRVHYNESEPSDYQQLSDYQQVLSIPAEEVSSDENNLYEIGVANLGLREDNEEDCYQVEAWNRFGGELANHQAEDDLCLGDEDP